LNDLLYSKESIHLNVLERRKKKNENAIFLFLHDCQTNALYDWTEFKRFRKKNSSLSKNEALVETDKLSEN